jgi:hypothetical protein
MSDQQSARGPEHGGSSQPEPKVYELLVDWRGQVLPEWGWEIFLDVSLAPEFKPEWQVASGTFVLVPTNRIRATSPEGRAILEDMVKHRYAREVSQ